MDRHSLILSQLCFHARRARAPERRPRRPRRRAHRGGPTAQGVGRRAPALRTGAAHRRRLHAGPPARAGDVTRLEDRLCAGLEIAARRDQIVVLGAEIGRAILRHREGPPRPGPAPPPAGAGRGGPGSGHRRDRNAARALGDPGRCPVAPAHGPPRARRSALGRGALRCSASSPSRRGRTPRAASPRASSSPTSTRPGSRISAPPRASSRLSSRSTTRTGRRSNASCRCDDARGSALAMKPLARFAEVTLDHAGRVEVTCASPTPAATRATPRAGARARRRRRDGAQRRAAEHCARAPPPHRVGGGRRGLRGRAGGGGDRDGPAPADRSPLAHDDGHARGDRDDAPARGRGAPDAGGLAAGRAARGAPDPPAASRPPTATPKRRRCSHCSARSRWRVPPRPDGEVFARVADLPAALVSLEAALAKDGRVEERLAVEEVRACVAT